MGYDIADGLTLVLSTKLGHYFPWRLCLHDIYYTLSLSVAERVLAAFATLREGYEQTELHEFAELALC